MMEILGDLEEKEEAEIKHMNYEKKINELLSENGELKKKLEDLMMLNQGKTKGINVSVSNRSMSMQERSIANQSMMSGMSSVADSFVNQSMTSEAAMMQLE